MQYFFYGRLIGKIDKLKYRYWDLTVHVSGRQMVWGCVGSSLWLHSMRVMLIHHCDVTVCGLCELITLMSPWPDSTRAVWARTVMSPWPLSMRTVMSLWCHRDIQVRLQFDATVTSQYKKFVSSSLWCHRDIQVRLHFNVTVTSHHEDFVSSSLWCHLDIQVRLQFDVAVTSPLWCHSDIAVDR